MTTCFCCSMDNIENDDRDIAAGLTTASLQEASDLLPSEGAHHRQLEDALRRALARSRAAEDELRDLLENTSQGLRWVDRDGKILWASQAELDLLGYTREEYVGRALGEFCVQPEAAAEMLQRLRGGEPIRDHEVAMRHRDGSIRHVLVRAGVRWEDGRFLHSRWVTRDITELKLSGDIANRLAAIVQGCDDAIVSKDLNGIVRSWNPSAERMFGYSSAEIVGRSIRLIIPGDRQAEEDEVLRSIRAGRTVDHFETIRRRKDGTEVAVSLTVSPVKDVSGRIVGASKIARDISLRRALEAERARLFEREQAARLASDSANRMKDEFLAMLSHELRTPLSAIVGWTQIAAAASKSLDEATARETTRQAVAVIERNALAQARLIDDLLDISRVVTGKLELKTTVVDLAQLAATVTEGARPSAVAKNIDLRLRLDAAIASVTGDAARLQQILWNLLSNAIKFTPKGGVIEVAVESDGLQVTMTVRDSGIGIDPEFLPHVFERFRQADATTTRRFGGLGLGLAVVHHLVRAHGGTVAARSPGQGFGATFVVTLPAASSPPPLVSARPLSARPLALHGRTVLVVDDEDDARDLMRYMLHQRGAEVVTAGSVQEALALLERETFDLLFADLGMPDRDGFDLISAIRTHARRDIRELRAIAVTAYAGEDARQKTLAAGYDEHVPKPVALDALAAAIGTVLGGDAPRSSPQPATDERAQPGK